ncbi:MULTISPECIES: hypothetical protein [unclassified Streptomyces]
MTHLTVQQFADAATPQEQFTGQWQNGPSGLDDYKPCPARSIPAATD